MTARSIIRRAASATIAVLAVVGVAGPASAAPVTPAPTTTVDDVPPVPGGAAITAAGAPGTLVTISGACGYDAGSFGYFFEYFVNGQPVTGEQWRNGLSVADDLIGSFSTSFHVPPAPPGMYTVHVWCDLHGSLEVERLWNLTFEVTAGRGGSTRR